MPSYLPQGHVAAVSRKRYCSSGLHGHGVSGVYACACDKKLVGDCAHLQRRRRIGRCGEVAHGFLVGIDMDRQEPVTVEMRFGIDPIQSRLRSAHQQSRSGSGIELRSEIGLRQVHTVPVKVAEATLAKAFAQHLQGTVVESFHDNSQQQLDLRSLRCLRRRLHWRRCGGKSQEQALKQP